MGALTLPESGKVYLDANGFIYMVERIEPYRALLDVVWRTAQAGQIKVITYERRSM